MGAGSGGLGRWERKYKGGLTCRGDWPEIPEMTTDPMPDDKPAAVRVTATKCARCGEPVQARYRPFCSLRCAEIDLGSWFTERYRVETAELPTDAPRQGEGEP